MSTLVIVPSGLRAARALRRLCDADGGVLLGPRVTTLSKLAPGMLAAAGDSRAILTPLAHRLLALDAARECGLAPATLEPSSGEVRAFAAALEELRDGEVPASALDAAGAAAGGRVGERLSACGRLLRAYEARLEALRALDGPGALAVAAASLARGRTSEEVRGLELFVLDGFTALSAAEWRLVEALGARARRTHVRLPFFPERPDLTAPEPLLRRLEAQDGAATRLDVELRLERVEEDRAPALACALLAVAGGPGGGDPGTAGGRIGAAAGEGEDGEAAVAASIAARWMDAGLAADDLLVFAPSPASVAERLARAFAEQGVPLARGVGDRLAENAAVRAVRRAMSAPVGLDRASAEELLSSSYVAGALPPARLRDLLDRAGALDGRLGPEEALRRRAARLGRASRERELLVRGAEALADLERRIAPLRGAGKPREQASRLRAFLDGGVRRRASRGEAPLVRRDLAALKQLEECADGVVTALAMVGRGSAQIAAAEWRSLLDLAVDVAAVPASDPAAGAVELWAVADAPGLSARAAIVTGCQRGSFPAAPARAALLRDPERAAVNAALGRRALRHAAAERAEAFHAAFCAIASARDQLALTWPSASGGRGGGPPAPLVAEVLAAVGERLDPAPRPPPPLAAAASPREALEAAARAAASGAETAAEAALRSASPELARRLSGALARAAVEREREAATSARTAAAHAGGVAPGALLAAALPAEWTPSQLETHARCPFRFFLETPCRLAAPEEAVLDVTPRDEGRLLHVILERFVRGRLDGGVRPFEDDDRARAELRAVAEEVFRELDPTGKLGEPAIWPARRELVLSRLERVLASEAAIAADDGLQPTLVEHAFGGESGAPPLVLADGQDEVRLCGRVDRIDASPERLRVLDWKNGRASSGSWRDKVDGDAFGVTSFQLPAYLIAAQRALPGRAALEAGYVFLRSASRSPRFATQGDDAALSLDPDVRARLRDAGERPFADAVLGVVARMREGRFPIAPRDCSGCSYGAVCRAEGSEEDDP